MAQTGFTPIALYYSSTASATPTAGNLVAGELALNNNDGRLFYKDSSNVVQVIGTKGGVGTSSTTQVLYNSSGLVVGSANLTFNGTTLTLVNDASISGLTVGKGGGAVATNTTVGATAGANQTSASALNTFVGYQAGSGVTSANSVTCIGSRTGNATMTGGENTLVGDIAGYSITSGSGNTFIGKASGQNVSTGGSNVCLGTNAGNNITTGGSNVYIGVTATASSVSVAGEIVIGSPNTTGKGASTAYINAGGGGSYQGNNSTLWSITSDQRLKKNIVDNTDGLNKITAIQVRNFEYRTADEVTELEPQNAIDIKGVQLGAIAQELQAILPDCVKTESTGVMSVDATNLTWYLINAVKELNAKVTALEEQLSKPAV